MNNIYISTFGKKVIKLKNGVPVEVGASNRSNFLYPIHDNIWLNISNENINKEELVGFCHFNKCLDVKFSKAYNLLINRQKYDFLVADKTYITPHPRKDELDAIVKILKKIIQNITLLG